MCRASGFTRSRVFPTQTPACIGREKPAKVFRLSAYIHSIPEQLTDSTESCIVHVPMHHALNTDAPHHFRYVRSFHGSLRKGSSTKSLSQRRNHGSFLQNTPRIHHLDPLYSKFTRSPKPQQNRQGAAPCHTDRPTGCSSEVTEVQICIAACATATLSAAVRMPENVARAEALSSTTGVAGSRS